MAYSLQARKRTKQTVMRLGLATLGAQSGRVRGLDHLFAGLFLGTDLCGREEIYAGATGWEPLEFSAPDPRPKVGDFEEEAESSVMAGDSGAWRVR